MTTHQNKDLTIDKQVSFSYGHRVWTGGSPCKHMHGHNGLINIEARQQDNPLALVAFETFVKRYLDQKFIVDLNDPWFNNIVNLEPVWTPWTAPKPNFDKPKLNGFVPRRPLNTTSETELNAIALYIANTQYLAGYVVDVSRMSGTEREFYEGFFFTTFPSTPELLAKWIYQIVRQLNPHISRVDWHQSNEIRGCYFE